MVSWNNGEYLDIYVPINIKFILHVRLRKNIVDERYATKITRGINTKYK